MNTEINLDYYWELLPGAEKVTLYRYKYNDSSTFTEKELKEALLLAYRLNFMNPEDKTKHINCLTEGLNLFNWRIGNEV